MQFYLRVYQGTVTSYARRLLDPCADRYAVTGCRVGKMLRR